MVRSNPQNLRLHWNRLWCFKNSVFISNDDYDYDDDGGGDGGGGDDGGDGGYAISAVEFITSLSVSFRKTRLNK